MTLFDDPNRFCPHAKRVDFGERDKAGLIRIITRLGFARIPPRKIIMQAVMKPFEIRIKGRYFREELRRDSGFFGKFPQAGLGFRFAAFYSSARNGPLALARGCAALDEQDIFAAKADNANTIRSF